MRSIIILTGLLFISSLRIAAQIEIIPSFEDTLNVYEGLFEIEEPLVLTLQFNIKEFQKTRRQEKYHPAEMTNHVSDSFQVTHPIRVMARGKYRRDNCTMPPYWMNIRYSGIEASQLQDIRRMKMVTRCRGSVLYQNYVLREYLVYKIYNLITDYSFRARLVKLKYVDTSRKNKETEDWAFLIEPDDLLAERLNAMVIKSDKLSIRTVNPQIMDLMAIFHYMIGHGDYSVTGRHNLKIITLKEQGIPGFIPIPYDFDYTGLVDAHYAVPGESLGIESVKERYYLGACRSKESNLEAINLLASYQEPIADLIMNFEYLDEDERIEMVAYIASYFVESQESRFIESRLATTCR